MWFVASAGFVLNNSLAAASDGEPARRWSSGVGSVTLEQATPANRPTFRARAAGTYGSLEFDGANGSMPFSPQNQNIVRNVAAATLSIVYTRSIVSPPAFGALFFTTFTGGAAAWLYAYVGSDGEYRFTARRVSTDSYSAAPATKPLDDNDGKAQVIACRYTYSSALAEVYRNAKYVGNQTAFGTSGSTADVQTNFASVGNVSSSSTTYLKGHIHDIALWNAALSDYQLRYWQDSCKARGAIRFY
jgi:hypothetical protein